jgi:hypothetical protein
LKNAISCDLRQYRLVEVYQNIALFFRVENEARRKQISVLGLSSP